MAFIAPDTDADEIVQPSGFTAPDSDSQTLDDVDTRALTGSITTSDVPSLVQKTITGDFDPASYASQFDPSHPQYKIASDVYAGYKSAPWTTGRVATDAMDFVKAVPETVKDFGLGTGEAIDNMGQAVTGIGTDDTGQQRAQLRSAVTEQTVEQNIKEMWDKMAGDGTFMGNFFKRLDAASAGASGDIDPQDAQALQDRTAAQLQAQAANPRQVIDDKFARRVANAKQLRSLAQGNISDSGLLSSAAQLSTLSGDAKPSDMFASPQDVGWSPEDAAISQTMANPANPTNLLPLHVPVLGEAANALADNAVTLAGKGLEASAPIIKKAAAAAALAGGIHGGLGEAVASGIGDYAAGQGAKVIGSILGNPEGLAARVGQDVVTDQTTAGGLAAGGAQRLRGALVGGLAAPVAMAPLNALTSDNPEEFAKAEGSAVGIGAAGGASKIALRPDIAAAASEYLKQEGAKDTGNAELDALHNSYMANASQPVQDAVNESRGFFGQSPATTEGGKVSPVNTYVVGGTDFVKQAKKLDPTLSNIPDADLLNQRGIYVKGKGITLINGDSPSNAAGGIPGTLGHEVGGHAAEDILRTMGAQGSPFGDALQDSLQKGLYDDQGNPTPDFSKFIDSYKQKAPGPIRSLPNTDTYFKSEFLAETAANVIAGKGLGDLAAPKSVIDKLTDNVGDFWSKWTGIDPKLMQDSSGQFNRTQVGAVNEAMTNALRDMAGYQFRGGQWSADNASRPKSAPEETPKAPVTAPIAPPEPVSSPAATPAPESAPIDPYAALGSSQEAVDEAGKIHTGDMFPIKSTPAGRKKIIAERQDEWNGLLDDFVGDAQEKGYQIPDDPSDLHQAVINHALGGEPPASNTNEPKSFTPNVTEPEVTANAASEPAPAFDVSGIGDAEPSQPFNPTVNEPEEAGAEKPVATMEEPRTSVAAQPEVGQKPPVAPLPLTEDEIADKQRISDAVSKLPADQKAKVNDLESRQGTTFLDYNSADKPTLYARPYTEGGGKADFTEAQRAKELADSTAQDRAEGNAPILQQRNKAFIPFGPRASKSGGVTMFGVSPDKITSNIRHILEASEAYGVPTGYDGLKDSYQGDPNNTLSKTINSDLHNALENQRNGYKGDGSGPFERFPDTQHTPPPNPDYAPVEIPKDRYDVINMAMNDQRSTVQSRYGEKLAAYQEAMADHNSKIANGEESTKPRKPAVPSAEAITQSEEAIKLARENDGYEDPESHEVNALRGQLRDKGFNPEGVLESPYEHLRPDLITAIHGPEPSGPELTVRPHGLDIDARGLQAPVGSMVSSGFLPDVRAGESPDLNPDVYQIKPGTKVSLQTAAGAENQEQKPMLTPKDLLASVRNASRPEQNSGTNRAIGGAVDSSPGTGEGIASQSGPVQAIADGLQRVSQDSAVQSLGFHAAKAAQTAALVKLSKENGIAATKLPQKWKFGSDDDVGGQEHNVFQDKPSDRVVKIVKPSMGLYPEATKTGWGMRGATPLEYLDKLQGLKDQFDLDTKIHGVLLGYRESQPQFITSQPNLHPAMDANGNPVDLTQDQITQQFAKDGFVPVGDTDKDAAYYRASDNRFIADAHHKNVVQLPDGRMSSFDSTVMHPGPELKASIQKMLVKSQPKGAPLDRMKAAMAKAFAPDVNAGVPEFSVTH